jgi:hypothetical protein
MSDTNIINPATLQPHPLADIFPLLDEQAVGFRALVDDIKVNGVQQPIFLYEGKVLDGRNRVRVCQLLKFELRTYHVREYDGQDPIGFVLSINLHRRHLNESQRAMVAAKLANLGQGANQHTKGQAPSIEGASKLLSVGHASVERAKAVLAKGDPSLVDAVQRGEMSVSAAAAQAKQQTQQQSSSPQSTTQQQSNNRSAPSVNNNDAYDKVEKRLIKKLQDLDVPTAEAAVAKTVEALKGELTKLKAAEFEKPKKKAA